MQNNIAVLLPYKDQFIKDNAGSASIWVKDFSRESKLKKNTTIIIKITFLFLIKFMLSYHIGLD